MGGREKIIVRRVRNKKEMERAFAIRYEVFVKGQKVPLEIEREGLDPVCTQVVCLKGDKIIGTARMREKEGKIKMERVAVLKRYQKRGVGTKIMEKLVQLAKRRGYWEAVVHAQEYVVPFYLKLGFKKVGKRFFEADIPHYKMVKNLSC